MRSMPCVYSNFLPQLPILLGLVSVVPVLSYANTTATIPASLQTETQASTQQQDELIFDSAFFRGSKMNQKALQRLSEGSDITPGIYKADIYVNNQFIENASVRFIETDAHQIQPCFRIEQLQNASILTQNAPADRCGTLESLVGAGSSQFDLARLRLDLSIPQSLIKQIPRGYVPPAQLNSGESIGFVNYYANYYHNNFDSLGQSYQKDSAYVSLNGGVNFGNWQFRQQSSLSSNDAHTEWNNIRSYVKRPIASIQSEFSAGQLTSSGRFFSGLSYNGVNLSTDDRMLPDSMRGYAPVVQGTAKTTAKVSIFQNGRELYQTTVAPGPFRISDLYPTSYNGDLNVVVTEADGSRSEFRIPFSAVPESVRRGAFKYNIDIGRTRGIGEDTDFTNITTQYGLNNAITLNNGLRIAEGYQAAMLGTAYTNQLGAFGTEMTYSHAKVPNEGNVQGWMLGANYSKTFQSTDTTVALAGYRFSTEGYRDLSDVIALRDSVHDGSSYQSATYKEQSRATVMLNQSFGDLGMVYVSGSASSYRDDKPDDYQFQLGYGKTFNNGVSLNLSASRQKTAALNYADTAIGKFNKDFKNDNETTFGLSVSIPLQKTKFARDLLLNYNGSSDQNSYQASLQGDIEAVKDLSYSAGVSYDDQSNVNVWNAGLNKRFNYASTALTASKGDQYWQASANIQGALAIHSGGLTFGPYLSETFALIEAKDAQGAHVLNAQGTKINKSGFALVPALTPYRYNTIALNPEGMSAKTELQVGDAKIAPYAGAAVKVNFTTRQGHAMLIQSKLENGIAIPLGAEVMNTENESIGIARQNGQIYLRATDTAGKVYVSWGDEAEDRCSIDYQIPQDQINEQLVRLNEICKIEN